MQKLKLITNDPWLEPYKDSIKGRYDYAVEKEKILTLDGKYSLSDMASGYLYFGLHRTASGWVFYEWAPNATAIYLIGSFNGWNKSEEYRLSPQENGVWAIELTADKLRHGDLYKLLMEWEGGTGERIPAWIRRVVQDDRSTIPVSPILVK